MSVAYNAHINYNDHIAYNGVSVVITNIATTWRPTDGHGEYTSSGAINIVDQNGVFLADPSGALIVSPLTTFTQLAATVWIENNAI